MKKIKTNARLPYDHEYPVAVFNDSDGFLGIMYGAYRYSEGLGREEIRPTSKERYHAFRGNYPETDFSYWWEGYEIEEFEQEMIEGDYWVPLSKVISSYLEKEIEDKV